MQEPFPLDKQALLGAIQTAYSEADALLARVPPDRLTTSGVCGHWSVKDIVAHLTTWEERTLRWLRDAEQGIRLSAPEPGFGWDQFDALNAQGYERHQDRPYADIQRDFYQTRQTVLAAVSALTEAELRGEGRFIGLFRDSPAAAVAANTYEHYTFHMAQVRDWLDHPA